MLSDKQIKAIAGTIATELGAHSPSLEAELLLSPKKKASCTFTVRVWAKGNNKYGGKVVGRFPRQAETTEAMLPDEQISLPGME